MQTTCTAVLSDSSLQLIALAAHDSRAADEIFAAIPGWPPTALRKSNYRMWHADQPPFVATRLVPIAASGRIEDRSFTATVLEAEAVVQITEGF